MTDRTDQSPPVCVWFVSFFILNRDYNDMLWCKNLIKYNLIKSLLIDLSMKKITRTFHQFAKCSSRYYLLSFKLWYRRKLLMSISYEASYFRFEKHEQKMLFLQFMKKMIRLKINPYYYRTSFFLYNVINKSKFNKFTKNIQWMDLIFMDIIFSHHHER